MGFFKCHFSQVSFANIVKFFNSTNHTCMNQDVDIEIKNNANDIKCSEKDFCEKHISKINIKIQNYLVKLI